MVIQGGGVGLGAPVATVPERGSPGADGRLGPYPRGVAPRGALTRPEPVSDPQAPSCPWVLPLLAEGRLASSQGLTAGLWYRLYTVISGSLARRGGVVGRPKAWPAPGQAPFVPGQHVSFYSVQVNEHPPNTCCIPCPAPGTTMGTHLRTAQPLSSRSSQAHSTHVLAELRTEIPWMGTPTLKPQLLPGGA